MHTATNTAHPAPDSSFEPAVRPRAHASLVETVIEAAGWSPHNAISIGCVADALRDRFSPIAEAFDRGGRSDLSEAVRRLYERADDLPQALHRAVSYDASPERSVRSLLSLRLKQIADRAFRINGHPVAAAPVRMLRSECEALSA